MEVNAGRLGDMAGELGNPQDLLGRAYPIFIDPGEEQGASFQHGLDC